MEAIHELYDVEDPQRVPLRRAEDADANACILYLMFAVGVVMAIAVIVLIVLLMMRRSS